MLPALPLLPLLQLKEAGPHLVSGCTCVPRAVGSLLMALRDPASCLGARHTMHHCPAAPRSFLRTWRPRPEVPAILGAG